MRIYVAEICSHLEAFSPEAAMGRADAAGGGEGAAEAAHLGAGAADGVADEGPAGRVDPVDDAGGEEPGAGPAGRRRHAREELADGERDDERPVEALQDRPVDLVEDG